VPQAGGAVAAARARLLDLAARIVAFEAQVDGEARRIAEELGEPPHYDDFLEERIPGTPHHELYRCASSFELNECAAQELVRAATARADELLAEWSQRRADYEERARASR
jgi:hypothetical protein